MTSHFLGHSLLTRKGRFREKHHCTFESAEQCWVKVCLLGTADSFHMENLKSDPGFRENSPINLAAVIGMTFTVCNRVKNRKRTTATCRQPLGDAVFVQTILKQQKINQELIWERLFGWLLTTKNGFLDGAKML
ncbi:hypothetical protein CEXT_305041 [Caerostris extrusa]|uniref:Uncharacterized protein n=1 Tax=Caerostris extrusa TaxID=172846 RepID=A0AAV4NYY6_CAEEX|nr:hypothetical protein CEXT_305041 [Caerostris extrusa]